MSPRWEPKATANLRLEFHETLPRADERVDVLFRHVCLRCLVNSARISAKRLDLA